MGTTEDAGTGKQLLGLIWYVRSNCHHHLTSRQVRGYEQRILLNLRWRRRRAYLPVASDIRKHTRPCTDSIVRTRLPQRDSSSENNSGIRLSLAILTLSKPR